MTLRDADFQAMARRTRGEEPRRALDLLRRTRGEFDAESNLIDPKTRDGVRDLLVSLAVLTITPGRTESRIREQAPDRRRLPPGCRACGARPRSARNPSAGSPGPAGG